MSSNAVVLSPYRPAVAEGSNAFDSLQVTQQTVLPTAQEGYVRINGGPTGNDEPSLNVMNDAGVQRTIYPNTRTRVTSPTTFLGSTGNFVYSGQDGQYIYWLHGAQCTVTWQASWTGSSGTTGEIRMSFTLAPKPFLNGAGSLDAGIFQFAFGRAGQQSGIAVAVVRLGELGGGMGLRLRGINDVDGGVSGSILASDSKTFGGTTGTVTYSVNPADL